MDFEVVDLGLIEFQAAESTQNKIHSEIKSGFSPSKLILCQHYPVITLGRTALRNNILVGIPELKGRGITVYKTTRGGDVTYHGPGQLTAYPIFDLRQGRRDIHFFLRSLEDAAINTFAELGLNTRAIPGLTGVWAGRQKIASIGIAIRNWITFHGLSLNIESVDLENFRLIRPCGMDIQMTSLESLLNVKVDIDEVKSIFIEKIGDTFGLGIKDVPLAPRIARDKTNAIARGSVCFKEVFR